MASSTHNPQTATLRPTKTAMGEESVRRVASAFRTRGFHVKSHLPYKSKFDLLCNGKRVEVKTAELRPSDNAWQVNIHRHGKLDESQVDVYAIELRADFLPLSVLLLIKSPLQAMTVQFSVNGLMRGKYAEWVDRWDLLEPIVKNPSLPELFQSQIADFYETEGSL